MFSLLRKRLKHRIVRIFHETGLIEADSQNWTRSITCCTCDKILPADARYCTYCGYRIKDHSTSTANNIYQHPMTDQISLKEITLCMPPKKQGHVFLEYTRSNKDTPTIPIAAQQRQKSGKDQKN